MSDNVASVDLLVRELCELAEWYTLGAYLGLTENEIREIEQDHHETARRRLAMLSKWVKKEANPSWAKIVSALERMSEMSLANQLREKYIRIRSNQVQPAAATASGMEPAALIVASADTAGEQSMTIMKVDRKELVVRKLEEVEEKYLELIVVTESALESVDPPRAKVRRFSTFYARVRVTTVVELFDILEQYCFLDYTLLEKIISFFLKKRAPFVVRDLCAYIQHLEGFKSSTTLHQFMESIEKAQKPLTTTQGVQTCTVTLCLVGGWLEKTMTNLDKLLKELFQDKKSVLSHIKIIRGSVIVLYLAPQSEAESLISLAEERLTFLPEVGVWGLRIGNTEVIRVQIDPSFSFESSLYRAILNSDTNLLSFLLNINANPNKLERGVSPLLFAIIGVQLPEKIISRIQSTCMVDLLLKANADPNLQSKNVGTSLFLASELGYTDVVHLLIKANANPNLQTDDGGIALHAASRNGHSDVVRVLLDANVDPDCQTHRGETPLMLASLDGHSAVVSMLLKANADPNISRSDNVFPLHMASQNGHSDIVGMLLKANANPNLQADNGITPLYYSCQYSHTNIVKLLLKAKANPDVQYNGRTPLFIASQLGYTAIVHHLLAANAKPNFAYNDVTALHISSQMGNSGIVNHLLKVKANPDLQTSEGYTPLILACDGGHYDVVDLLLKANANPNLLTHEGATPMTMASQRGHSNIVGILLDANANSNYQTEKIPSPLALACLHCKPETVRLLLKRGVDPNLQLIHSSGTVSALMCACRSGCLESAELLLMSGADLSMLSPRGISALEIAAYRGHYDIVHLIQAVELSQSSTTSSVLTDAEIATNLDIKAMSLLIEAMENMLVTKSEVLISTQSKSIDKSLLPKQTQEIPQTLTQQ